MYPDDCRICGRALVRASRVPVCEACLTPVEPLSEAVCSRCGVPFENERQSDGAGHCGACRLEAPEFDWARGYGAYEGTLRHLIHLLKYAGMRPLARPLAGRLTPLLTQAGPVDLIVPVPLDAGRRRARGFNQAELLARELSRLSGVACETGALRRIRATETQTGLTNQQRRENVAGAFEARRGLAAGRNVLLIDDVITTGATAASCARALKRAGAARVAVVALARARSQLMDVPAPMARAAGASW